MRVSLGLVNELVVQPADSARAAVLGVLCVDPASVAGFRPRHVEVFRWLANELFEVVAALDEQRVDAAATTLNELLRAVPASPHLAHEDGRWQLHHHAHGADLAQAWISICAESIARLIGAGHADRMHRCAAPDCRRAFLDTTKNATRQYCSERCQNRLKAAALRRRRASR